MDWLLIEAPIPHAPEGKYKSQMPSPNNLLQVATAIRERGEEVIIHNFTSIKAPPVVEKADNFVMNLSECTVMDYCLDHALDYLHILRFYYPEQPFWLTGFYSWLHKNELQVQGFKVADPLRFEDEIVGDSNTKDYHLSWDIWDFSQSPSLGGRRRATIRASRGCPRHCLECPVYLVYRQHTRYFSPEWVLNEIKELYNRGVREISFLDDNLCANNRWIKQILNSIIECKFKGLHFTFEEGMEVYQALDEELVGLLKKAGFYHIKLGVESLNTDTLKFMRKGYTDPQMAVDAIKNLQKCKLNPVVFLCFGFPTDTEESLRYTIEKCVELGVKLRVQILWRYPGISFAECPVSVAKLKRLQQEAMYRTNSCAWRKAAR
jgi:radical SAM superfamily enzyme YgiQ (UPF0313 family)